MAEAEQRTGKPGTLLSQWWTVGAIALDPRTAGRHITTAWVIIDRYMQSRGNSRASLRYIETATGLSRPTVIGACRELVEWGYFSRHLGKGTRPTEYAPNWLVVNPSLPQASGQRGLTSGGQEGLTATDASGEHGITECLLTSPADKPADGNVGKNTPEPPAPAGLAAAEPCSRDPFNEFWKVYPRKHGIAKARAAWSKLDPDDELAERIIAGAQALANHYAANPVEKRWMPEPKNWLSDERWLEDLPEPYVDAREAAIARKVADRKTDTPSNDNGPPAIWIGDVSPFVAAGRHATTIKSVFCDNDNLVVTFDIERPDMVLGDVEHRFATKGDGATTAKARTFVDQLFSAAGLKAGVDMEVENLAGTPVFAVVGRDGSIRYERRAA